MFFSSDILGSQRGRCHFESWDDSFHIWQQIFGDFDNGVPSGDGDLQLLLVSLFEIESTFNQFHTRCPRKAFAPKSNSMVQNINVICSHYKCCSCGVTNRGKIKKLKECFKNPDWIYRSAIAAWFLIAADQNVTWTANSQAKPRKAPINTNIRWANMYFWIKCSSSEKQLSTICSNLWFLNKSFGQKYHLCKIRLTRASKIFPEVTVHKYSLTGVRLNFEGTIMKYWRYHNMIRGCTAMTMDLGSQWYSDETMRKLKWYNEGPPSHWDGALGVENSPGGALRPREIQMSGEIMLEQAECCGHNDFKWPEGW